MLVDTNIIVFSLSKHSSKQERAKKFLKNIKDPIISHQNINEIYRVITHSKFKNPMNKNKSLKVVSKIISSMILIFPKDETIFTTYKLAQKYNITGNKIFDTYLVSTMLSNGVSKIATDNDKDFKIYKGIKVINPFK